MGNWLSIWRRIKTDHTPKNQFQVHDKALHESKNIILFFLRKNHNLFKHSLFCNFNYNIYKNTVVIISVPWSLHKSGIIFLGLVPWSFIDGSKLACGLIPTDGPHGLDGEYHFFWNSVFTILVLYYSWKKTPWPSCFKDPSPFCMMHFILFPLGKPLSVFSSFG